jgi:hypothetical protein
MRCTFILVGLLVMGNTYAQKPVKRYLNHAKENWGSYALVFTSGTANGTMDVLQFKYQKSVFPSESDEKFLGLSEKWWNPDLSWQNKYKDWPADQRAAWPGAKTWSVWATDGWHASKTLSLKTGQIAVVVYKPPPKKSEWWFYVLDAVAYSILFSSGWHLSNELLIR